MDWLRFASKKIVLDINGKPVAVSPEKLGDFIRDKIRHTPSLMKLFQQFGVDPERLDQLQFQIADLKDMYAETDDKTMTLNKSLFEGGNFFEQYGFVVAHEIVHWLSRIKEQDAYFHDPEEVLGFVSSIAYEMSHGSDLDTIWNKVYPKVSFHFHDEADAKQFFEKSIEKAKILMM